MNGGLKEKAFTEGFRVCLVIDLHSHILPGIDDGAPSLDVALDMARLWVADGVTAVACTPHILPGRYANDGPGILAAVAELQLALVLKGIDLKLVAGADNHIAADFVAGLKSGRLLTLAASNYVLVEPPHHICPPRLDQFFFGIMMAGYVPILTHPERLTWIENSWTRIEALAQKGVWMQVTAGSLTGQFGRRPKYWAEKLIDARLTAILASDAHNSESRPPDLKRGFEAAAERLGHAAALDLVRTRPQGILDNKSPTELPALEGLRDIGRVEDGVNDDRYSNRRGGFGKAPAIDAGDANVAGGRSGGWLQRVFKS